MSLTFDTTQTPFHRQTADEQERQWPAAQTAIMLTMVIGLGHWTPKNIDEVVLRLRFLEATGGPLMRSANGRSAFLSRDGGEALLRSLVGLRTNVRAETRAAFVRRITTNWFLDQTNAMRRASRSTTLSSKGEHHG